MFRRRHGHGGANVGLLLLAMQVMQIGLENIPPVTLGLFGINVAVFFQHALRLPDVRQVCIHAPAILFGHEFSRLVFAAFYHLSDMHLYFNMSSLLWKGRVLEQRFGSGRFLWLTALLLLLTHTLMVVLAFALARLDLTHAPFRECAAVVLQHHRPPDAMERIMGMFPVPVRLAAWAELLLIHVMVPNASFTGHLCGIIAGLIYTRGWLDAVLRLSDGVPAAAFARRAARRRYDDVRGQARDDGPEPWSREGRTALPAPPAPRSSAAAAPPPSAELEEREPAGGDASSAAAAVPQSDAPPSYDVMRSARLRRFQPPAEAGPRAAPVVARPPRFTGSGQVGGQHRT